MWRNYRAAVSSSRGKEWLQIIVDFLDNEERQRSRTVRSYGQLSNGNLQIANEWVALLSGGICNRLCAWKYGGACQ